MRPLKSMTKSVEPMFLDGARGRIFALHFSPVSTPRAHLIFLPPFCEEMNRCRHLVAMQAKIFAGMGYSCLILDLFGTGDSEGELADATWDTWHADVLRGVQWCEQQRSIPIVLWGLRLGALLALDLAATNPGRFSKLLLWQPVTNGKTFLTQVLRARIAYLSGNELPPETTEQMRLSLHQGNTVEVAGYVLGGRLASDIDTLSVNSIGSLENVRIYWLQHSTRPDESLSAGVKRAIDDLESRGCFVEVTMFQSPQIWQLSERADCSQLIDKTSALAIL